MSSHDRPIERSGTRLKAARRLEVVAIDDHGPTLELVEECLARRGMVVRCARTLAAARTLIAERAPDVVLVDLALPDGAGHHLARDLRIAPETRAIARIGVSGVALPGHEVLQYFDAYLHEPIDFRLLPDLVVSLALASRKTTAAAGR